MDGYENQENWILVNRRRKNNRARTELASRLPPYATAFGGHRNRPKDSRPRLPLKPVFPGRHQSGPSPDTSPDRASFYSDSFSYAESRSRRRVPTDTPPARFILRQRNLPDRTTQQGPDQPGNRRYFNQRPTRNLPPPQRPPKRKDQSQRIQNNPNFIHTDDEDFTVKVRLIYKILVSHHHLHNISGPEPPPSIRKATANLASFIRPAAPTKNIQKRLVNNANNWEKATIQLLKKHYEQNLKDDLKTLALFPTDLKGPFLIATNWARRNFGSRVTQQALNNAETSINNFIGALDVSATDPLIPAVQPSCSSPPVSHPLVTGTQMTAAPLTPSLEPAPTPCSLRAPTTPAPTATPQRQQRSASATAHRETPSASIPAVARAHPAPSNPTTTEEESSHRASPQMTTTAPSPSPSSHLLGPSHHFGRARIQSLPNLTSISSRPHNRETEERVTPILPTPALTLVSPAKHNALTAAPLPPPTETTPAVPVSSSPRIRTSSRLRTTLKRRLVGKKLVRA